jgi:hypothetical protein
MARSPDDRPEPDPATIRRVVKETRVFVDQGLREMCEKTFGHSQDVILADPALLEPFLDHASPALRADAATFLAIHWEKLRGHFPRFPRRCVESAEDGSCDRQVRLAAITALGFLWSRSRESASLAVLARLALDADQVPAIRNRAYDVFVSSIDVRSVPGALEALLRLPAVAIRHEPLTDIDTSFVRAAMATLCPSWTPGAGP